MKLLGVNEFTHDASVALIQNGKIICSAEEERFSRKKHHYGFDRKGGPPILSLEWLLEKERIRNLGEFDETVLSWSNMSFSRWYTCKKEILDCYRAAGVPHFPGQPQESDISLFLNLVPRYLRREWYLQKLRLQTKVVEIEHHRAHASFAYRTSPFEEALVIVLDGSGEDVATSVHLGKGNTLQEIKRYPISQSIGTLYAIITRLLGLGRDNEGKTMGLAGYGKPLKKKILEYDEEKDSFIINYSLIKTWENYQRKKEDPILQIHKDIASTLQENLNQALLKFVLKYAKQYQMKNICIGGGVALNCVTNGLLLANPYVSEIYVPPAPNDGGNAIGGCLEYQSRFTDCYKLDLKNAFLGHESKDAEIRQALESEKLVFTKSQHLSFDLAKDLLEGKIVGLSTGKAELGPRALGNRSILCDPRTKGIKDRVNKEVKHRESWRPFGIMILEEDMEKLFGRKAYAPFMNIAFQATPAAKAFIPDLIHVDGTVRVQTVSRQNSPFHFELLKEIKKKAGFGVLLNTSFNDEGEPLVNTPNHAIKTFKKTGIEVLYLSSYRVIKP